MVLSRIRRLFSNRIAQNAAALFVVQLFNYVLPLATLPYLTRVLDQSSFGLVGFAQSFAVWLSVVGEYGFNYSATRSIARQRDRQDAVAGIVMSIIGAKLLLVFFMLLATVLAVLTIPYFRDHTALAFWALLIAVAAALNPIWYFQAIEKAWFMAVLEVCARTGHLLGVFILVKNPNDAWLALAAQGVAAAITAVTALWVMYRQVPFKWPTLALSWVALKVSWSLFVARASDSFYTSANGMILGLITNPLQVAIFTAVERLARAGLNMLFPLVQAIYPRINSLMRKDAAAAIRLSQVALLATTGLGFLGGFMLALLAPWLVAVLAPTYKDSIPVLQVLALLLPVVGFGYSLSMQYMFPRRMDREVLFSVAVAGVVNVTTALILAPKMGALGMAIAVVSAEVAASLVRFGILRMRGIL